MDEGKQDSKQSSKEFTEVINRNIAAGHEKDYAGWLQRFMTIERQFPGYLGTTIIAPEGNISLVWYIINRFADQASFDTWKIRKRSPQTNRGS